MASLSVFEEGGVGRGAVCREVRCLSFSGVGWGCQFGFVEQAGGMCVSAQLSCFVTAVRSLRVT